jgi:hypothetical protein
MPTYISRGGNQGGVSRLDFDEIRHRNPLLDYCLTNRIKLHQSGAYWIGKCPIHNERNGEAFVVHNDRCFCNGKCTGRFPQGLDVIDLDAVLHGDSIAEAAQRLGGTFTVEPITRAEPEKKEIPVPTRANPLALPYLLSGLEIAETHRCSHRLLVSDDSEPNSNVSAVCDHLGWQPATVRGLALDGYLGLSEEGFLTFNFESGSKSRWKEADGSRRFRFNFGKPWFWRGGLIPDGQTIFLTEGETDAITLIDHGLERGGAIVTGLPAGNFKPGSWAFLFKAKAVVFFPDSDPTGSDAATEIQKTIGPVAASLCVLQIHEVIT